MAGEVVGGVLSPEVGLCPLGAWEMLPATDRSGRGDSKGGVAGKFFRQPR